MDAPLRKSVSIEGGIAAGIADLLKATSNGFTVKKDFVGDWYITITTDAEGLEPAPKTGRTAGFDFGLKDFSQPVSDGTKYQSPEFYKSTAKLIKRASRALSRKQKG